MWEDENIKGKQDELVEILQEKYGLSMRVMSNVEAIEGNENGQSNSV